MRQVVLASSRAGSILHVDQEELPSPKGIPVAQLNSVPLMPPGKQIVS
jgi:hypothetical protein